MTLNEYATAHRMAIFEELKRGVAPSEGAFDEAVLREATIRGAGPQLGSLRYEPDRIHFEYIYPAKGSSALLFRVSIDPPERIVYLAVPTWVIQSVWEGEVLGSYHFESDADRLLQAFAAGLVSESNRVHFGEDPTTGGRGA